MFEGLVLKLVGMLCVCHPIHQRLVVLTDGRAHEEFSRNNGTSSLNFGRYKVYQIRPRTEEQLKQLELFEQQGIVDFWHMPFTPNATADVMLDEGRQEVQQFHKFIQQFGIDSKVWWKIWPNSLSKKKSGRPIAPESLGKRANSFGITMGEYHSYDEILAFMSRIERQLPADTVQLRSIGKSAEGRDIRGIQFGKPRDFTRQVVWIDAGMHSREWTAIHTAVYFIYYIANEMVANPHLHWSNTCKFWMCSFCRVSILMDMNTQEVIPEIHRSDSGAKADHKRGVTPTVRTIDGAAEGWISTETLIFALLKQAPPTSPRCGFVVRFTWRIPAMVTMHAYSQLWIYPFSHRKHSYPADIAELKAVARRAVDAIGEKFGTHYMTGTGPEIIYAYAGGSADWAKQTAGIKYTYTIELRPSYWSWNGFILEKAQLIPTAKETFDGIMVVLETVYEKVLANTPAKLVTATPIVAPSTAITTVRTVNPTVNTPSFLQKPVIFFCRMSR
uniref:Peptidase M14 carboxypeptidase A domain-containing protein n=1 Tax=Ditylenchus dipsaci TaxID=166011 RepID=A0A915DMS4_9BILA